MRTEIFKLWHLVQKRNSLMDAAASVSSPGFEPHYGSGRSTEAPFEHYVITACDMDEEIDEAVMTIVRNYEDDNRRILEESSGQRQRALRLRFICSKTDEYIAERLGINIKTVESRLKGDTAEQASEGKFATYCFETKLLPIDAEIEDHLAMTFVRVEEMVGAIYEDVSKLIHGHWRLAEEKRKEYEERTEKINGIIDGMEGKKKIILQMWVDGEKLEEIAKEAECSVRYVKRVIKDAKIYDDMSI